jgi:hypothetical protein
MNDYIFTFYDNNGFMGALNVNMTAPAISAAATKTNANCGSNGCINFFVFGGMAPFTYTWQPAVSSTNSACGLSAGTYSMMAADANGCLVTLTTSLLQTGLQVTGPNTNSSTCGGANATATINASGGTTPYTYTWTTSPVQTNSFATGLSPGSYSVMVSDNTNTCVVTNTFTIYSLQYMTMNLTTSSPACFGMSTGSISAQVSGVAPLSYTWVPTAPNSSVFTNAPAGNYTCMSSDANGCLVTGSVTLTQPPALTLQVSAVSPTCIGCCNGSISFTTSGGTPSFTYTVSNGSVTTGTTVTNLCAGSYTVNVVDANGCPQTVTVQLTSPPTGLSHSNADAQFELYPNPSRGEVFIRNLTGESASVFIYNLEGRMVYQQTDVSNNQEVQAQFAKGVYLIRIQTAANIFKKKLVIE